MVVTCWILRFLFFFLSSILIMDLMLLGNVSDTTNKLPDNQNNNKINILNYNVNFLKVHSPLYSKTPIYHAPIYRKPRFTANPDLLRLFPFPHNPR